MESSKIQEKIDNFIKTHPQYMLYKEDAVISVMIENGIFTTEELEVLESNQSLFMLTPFQQNIVNNISGIFGGNFSKQIQKTPLEKMQELIKKVNLEECLDENFNFEDLTVENIVEKLGKDNCEVASFDENIKLKQISFKDKSLKNIKIVVNEISKSIVINNRTLSISICDNEKTFGEIVQDNNGYVQNTYLLDGTIRSKCYLDNDKTIIYNNGYPYIELNIGESAKNILVEDLIKDINAKNALGLPTTRKSIKENVLNRITSENAAEVFELYKETTGNDLVSDIKNEWGLNTNLKNKLIEHLENIAPPEYIAQKLADSIYGIGSGDLKKYVKMINKDNVQKVISAYKKITIQKDFDFLKIPKTENIYILPSSIIENLIGGTGSGLILDIKNEFGLSDDTQKEYIDYITKIVLECMEGNRDIYSDDIRTDIIKHRKDLNKLDIDIMRFAQRRPAEPDEQNSAPNGMIDMKFRQNKIGDCWLVSGLMSISAKPEGKKFLESLITVDSKTGDVIVNLKGVNKKYRIKSDIIEKSNHLSVGDGDIRALEIAIDFYLKNEAYDKNNDISIEGKVVDIEANITTTLYNLLFGESKLIEDINKIKQIDFNDSKKFYTTGFNSPEEPLCKTDNGGTIALNLHHAYVILKEYETNIYLYDPNRTFDPQNIDEERIIKINKEEYYAANPHVSFAELPNQT